MKAKITGFVYLVCWENGQQTPYWTQSSQMAEADSKWVLVGPHDFEIEVPDDFDPRPQQIAAIDAAIAETRAKLTARITELQEQRSRYLALELAA